MRAAFNYLNTLALLEKKMKEKKEGSRRTYLNLLKIHFQEDLVIILTPVDEWTECVCHVEFRLHQIV